MREIKFRAWHKAWERMMTNKEMNDYNAPFIKNVLCFPTNVILMQYTGLKDKDGKEIYEGDIIEIDGGGKEKSIGKVDFQYGCFIFCADWIKNNHFPELKAYIDMAFCRTEIIGNIYENLELIK